MPEQIRPQHKLAPRSVPTRGEVAVRAKVYGGVYDLTLKPQQARQLARDLERCADEVEGRSRG